MAEEKKDSRSEDLIFGDTPSIAQIVNETVERGHKGGEVEGGDSQDETQADREGQDERDRDEREAEEHPPFDRSLSDQIWGQGKRD